MARKARASARNRSKLVSEIIRDTFWHHPTGHRWCSGSPAGTTCHSTAMPPSMGKKWKLSKIYKKLHVSQFLGVEFDGRVYFSKKLFWPRKRGFFVLPPKQWWRHHMHVQKLVSPAINVYHQGLKLVQSTASELNCIYDFLWYPPYPNTAWHKRIPTKG